MIPENCGEFGACIDCELRDRCTGFMEITYDEYLELEGYEKEEEYED